MRRTVTAAAAAVLLLTTVGCDVQARREIEAEKKATEQGPPPPARVAQACTVQGRAPKIGIVPINLQALFFNQINTGAQTVARKAGAQVQIVNGNDDSTTQANAIDDMVAGRYDAIIVDAVDTEGIKPAVRRAEAAGIPVVAVDATVDDPAVATQVGTANAEGGRQLGETLVKSSGGKGEIGVVGALNSTIQNERQKGFTDAVTAGGMKIKTVVDGRNIQENAQTAAENLLTGNPGLPYAYATGERPDRPGGRGGRAAAHRRPEGRRLGPVPAGGGRAAGGWITGVVQQNTFRFGYEAMNAAIDLACKRTAPKDVPVPTQIVTPANVKDYLYYLEK